MKRCFLLCITLPASLFAGSLRAQATDSADTQMQGELKEVEVRSPYAKWQEDAARNRLIYRKELGDAVFRPEIKPESLRVDGLVTNFMLKISGKKKRAIKFKTEMERNEAEDLQAIRYTRRL